MELEVARQILLYHLRGEEVRTTFPESPQRAPQTGTYQGLFHGTIPLHHTAVLINQELQGGHRGAEVSQWPAPAIPMALHSKQHICGWWLCLGPRPRQGPWTPSLTLVKFHLMALQRSMRL